MGGHRPATLPSGEEVAVDEALKKVKKKICELQSQRVQSLSILGSYSW